MPLGRGFSQRSDEVVCCAGDSVDCALIEGYPCVKVGVVGIKPGDGFEAASKEGLVGVGWVEVAVRDKAVDILLTISRAEGHV